MSETSELPPGLMPLWHAVHRRLSSGRPVTAVRIGPLDAEQREAFADLFGLDRAPRTYTVRLEQLDAVLRGSIGLSARETVERIISPLGDGVGDRRRAEAERNSLWTWLDRHPVVAAQPALRDWVAGVRRAGLIDGSVETTRARLTDAFAVVEQLPATGEPLPVFADRVLGDTHALDEGRPCAGLALRALAAIYGHARPGGP